MGALHAGHLSLVRAASEQCDEVVVTIFVNPTQFGPAEDLDRYPRTLPQDLDLLSDFPVTAVFHPSAEVVYPPGFSTYVDPPAVARLWEGVHRPEHFRGVATVVLKLFQMLPADVAYFGQKDYQQVCVIEAMVRDLNLAIEVCRCPIVREHDGLAMSSRNRYLSAEDRQRAVGIHASLEAVRHEVAQGERRVARLQDLLSEQLRSRELSSLDYAVIVDAETLEPLEHLDRPAVVLVAAHVGSTRLIDNCVLEG